jgi:hypothetical protein
VLHGECVRRPKDGGSSPDRAGDVEAEEELRWPPVVLDDQRRTLQVGGRERGE